MFVSATEVDSRGNGTIGAFGKGSTSGVAAATGAGEVSGSRLSAVAAEPLLLLELLFGRSHFSQTIPCDMSRPHIRQFVFIQRAPGIRDVTPVPGDGLE